jgi:RimJ/RimL family protein N-acetyltransferase
MKQAGSPIIRAERLDLVLLPQEALRLSLASDAPAVERILGLSVPTEWFEEQGLIRFRLHQLAEQPQYQPWSVRAIAIRARRQMVGYINCHSWPGDSYLRPFSKSGVEYGFEVFPPFRRQGYAREACQALMKWAFENYHDSEFIVSIAPDNIPSLRLAGPDSGVGSHIDKADGLEDVFKLEYLPNVRPNNSMELTRPAGC